MLLALSIRSLALVDALDLDLAPGLNVLTGETGAGKSLILGSVGLLLGERADATWLRSGASRGAVEGTFDLSDRADLLEALHALEVETEEGRVVLRREIAADGKTRAFVNGRGVLLAQLRAIGDLLVDVHGQHEHQQLLAVDHQTDFVDRWAGTWEERRALEIERASIVEERARIVAARAAHEKDRAEEEALRADLAELEAAVLDPGEEETLLRERDRLHHRERLLASLGEALGALIDEDGGAEPRFRHALKSLRSAATLDPGLLPLAERAEAASEEIAAIGTRLEIEREQLREEPLDLEDVEARLDRIHRLKRRHRTDLEGLIALREGLAVRVRALEPTSGAIARLEQAFSARIAAYERRLTALLEARAARFADFSRDVGALLARLGFGKATLQVAPAEGDRSRPAIDPAPIPALEFAFQPNPGEPSRPLRRIASGGELSRVMLAIKSLMAERDQVAVLVFDEVDQGIGGAAGEEVGRLLRALGARRQVLCITHLPLIAAHAGRQFQVAKRITKGRSITTVAPLEEAERVAEIARLLAGARVTETTLVQARELLRAAQQGAAAPPRRRSSEPGVRTEPERARRVAKGDR